ncbi:MAG TPA: glycosyltransferase family 4 protein [Solirubrobacteraceae bacterium]|nr:glycosyltransferase family 4 protein [Solirubrobacteraceae bacterium]
MAGTTPPAPDAPAPAPSAPRSVLLGVPRWTRDGGISAHVQVSAAVLAGRGLDVRVMAARVEPGDAPAGVTVYRCPELFKSEAPMQERLGEALSFAPDVVHLHQVDLPEVVAALRARAAVVVSAHVYAACTSGLYYFRPGQECTRAHGPACVPNLLARGCAHTRNLASLPARYRGASRRLEALRGADLVISYSGAIDRHLAANGLARRRVVPLPATVAPPAQAAEASRPRVLFAGRIVAQKGVAVLIRAARELDAELVICGEGRELPAMRRLAQRAGVAGRVTFTGWLDAEQLAREFAAASVVAMPSLWPEPFGLVGIEAFAAGKPVVASDTGGVREWLDDGVSGLCVRPGDARALARALAELLGDRERARAMGAAGRRLARERFSPQRHLEALLDAYAQARLSWGSRRADR